MAHRSAPLSTLVTILSAFVSSFSLGCRISAPKAVQARAASQLPDAAQSVPEGKRLLLPEMKAALRILLGTQQSSQGIRGPSDWPLVDSSSSPSSVRVDLYI